MEAVVVTPAEEMHLLETVNSFLREDIAAPVNLPMFDESAVDGYAFAFDSLKKSNHLTPVFEVKAGEYLPDIVGEGQCARIFTGAALPKGTDTIIKQEDTKIIKNSICIVHKHDIIKGDHVRYRGEQCKAGEPILPRGSMLNPAALGLLASLGITHVKASRKPRVCIVSTGNEVIEPGKKIQYGQKYDSNTWMLQAAFLSIGIRASSLFCSDHLKMLTDIIKQARKQFDILLICGGVSVGDYDFTLAATKANNYQILFHGVAQKPGKPLLFARNENQILFGLPGNPRAVAIAFYLYIKPYIFQMMHARKTFLPAFRVALKEQVKIIPGRTHFLSARMVNGKAVVLSGQGSHMLLSLALADILIELDAREKYIPEGTMVKAYPIN